MTEKDPQQRIRLFEIENILSENKAYKRKIHIPNKSIDFLNEIELLQILAKKGVPYAQYLLSRYYQKGEIVEQNFTIAFHLNSSAAKYKLVKAQFDLAKAYRDGKGVNSDMNKSFDFFSKAARQGHEHSQYALAKMFDQGIGTSSVKTVAKYWYKQAAMSGHKEAIKKLKNFH